MTSHNIKIDLDIDKIIHEVTKTVKTDIESRAHRSADYVVSEMFRGTGTWGKPSGVGYDIIKQQIDNYVESSEFEDIINDLIKKHTNEAAENAVKTFLDHAARKKLFKDVWTND